MKRALSGLVLGTLLALNLVSVAAAKVIGFPQPEAAIYQESRYSALTVIDAGSRQSARLLALDAIFYPESLGAGLSQMPDPEYPMCMMTRADLDLGDA